MWSGHTSFLTTSLSQSETVSTLPSCSVSKPQTATTVSINRTNIGVKSQNNSHPNTKSKSYSEFKSLHVNNVRQTIRRFDEKYSLKPDKLHKAIPVQNDVLSTFHTDYIAPSSDTNSKWEKSMLVDVKPNPIKSGFLQSPYSSLKYSQGIRRLLSPVDVIAPSSRKRTPENGSLSVPENTEFADMEFSLGAQLTDGQTSSHNKVPCQSSNDLIQEQARPPVQTNSTKSDNISFGLNDRTSEVSVIPRNTSTKFRVQSEEMLNKPQWEKNITRIQQTSRMLAPENTAYQVRPKESVLEICDEINRILSDDSLQENSTYKLSESEDKVISSCSNSAGNIFTNSEAVLNSNLGHLHNTNFLFKSRTEQDLPPTNLPASKTNISLRPTHFNTKEATQVESSQENSVVSELSDSNILSTGSHGFFKSLPYKILTVKDLVITHEAQNLEETENSGVQRGIKGSKENRTGSGNKVDCNIDTRKMLLPEIEQKTTLDSLEEVNDEIEEEIDGEIEEETINATSINDLSVKTNSSYVEMMGQLYSPSENKYSVQKDLSENDIVSSERTNISPKSLSSPVVSNKFQEEGSDMEGDLSFSLKLEPTNKVVSTSHEPSLAKSRSHLDSEESLSLGSNSSETEIKSLEDPKYCSIGIQADINEAYHPVLCAKNDIQHSSYSQPTMHASGGKLLGFQEIMPLHRYCSRTEGQEKTAPLDLALSVVLRHQIELTKHFITSQQRMYEAYCTSVENMSANYKPVTLEDTKQYIRSNLRRRDRLREEME